MYSVFVKLLEMNGLTVADVCRATGIRQSTLSNWKKRNNLLSGKNAQIIADFFHVSVDYLMTGKEETEGNFYYFDPETRATAEELRTNKELRVLFDAARTASPEDLRTAHAVLLALKRKEQHIDE